MVEGGQRAGRRRRLAIQRVGGMAAASLAWTLWPCLAHADEAPLEIEVRGRRPPSEPAREHDGEALDARSVTSLSELPALDAALGTGEAGVVTLRGIDAHGPLTTDTEGLAGVYLGGLRLPQFALRLGRTATWDLARVRVSRGPQLFEGRHAPVGAIRLEPRAPRAWGSGGRARLSVGAPLESEAGLAVEASPAEAATLRAAVTQRLATGSVYNETQDSSLWAAERELDGRVLARWSLPSGALVSAGAYGLHRYAGLPDVELSRAPEQSVSLAGSPSFERHTLTGGTLGLDHRLSELFHASVRSSLLRHDFFIHFDDAFSPEPDGYRQRGLQLVALDAEPRLEYVSRELSLLLGAYGLAERQRPDALLREAPTDLGVVQPVVRSSAELSRSTWNAAVYARAQWELSSWLRLSAGLRLDHASEARTVRQQARRLTAHGALDPVLDAALTSLLPDADERATTTSTEFLPMLGASLRLPRDVEITWALRRGYRPGGLRHVPAQGGFEAYRAEHLLSHDLGARVVSAGGRLSTSVNAFLVDWTNQQVRVERDTLGLDARVVNAAESAVYGLELTADYRVTSSLRVFANAGLQRAVLTRLIDPATAEDYSGRSLPYARSVVLVSGVEYRGAAGYYAGLDARVASGAFSDVANRSELGGMSSVGAHVGRTFRRVGLGLFARNLGDARAVAWRNDTLARPLVVLQPGRQLGLSLDARW